MFKAFLSRLALAAVVLATGTSAVHATAFTLDLGVFQDTVNVNGALWREASAPSGSGSYTALYRINAAGSGVTSSGFNDFTGTDPFNQVGGVGIKQIDLKDLPVINIGGIDYVRLEFDANNDDGLTFTDFRIFLKSDPNDLDVAVNPAPTTEAGINTTNFGPLAYDMLGTNTGGTNTIELFNIPSGSGVDDMSINIPLSNFTSISGWSLNDDVYIWAKLTGETGGFEEFAFVTVGLPTVGQVLVPEAHTVWGGGAMVAGLLVGAIWQQRRRKLAAAKA